MQICKSYRYDIEHFLNYFRENGSLKMKNFLNKEENYCGKNLKILKKKIENKMEMVIRAGLRENVMAYRKKLMRSDIDDLRKSVYFRKFFRSKSTWCTIHVKPEIIV